jgi:hypothetical protein
MESEVWVSVFGVQPPPAFVDFQTPPSFAVM